MKAFRRFLINHPTAFSLSDQDPSSTEGFTDQQEAESKMESDLEKLIRLQECLHAANKFSVLIILQAMDAAGKDGVIKHVMGGLNPQGCVVKSFKHPSDEEYSHDYFWRVNKALPTKGQIGIFNRSYYENVLICRVHPELILNERLPKYDDVSKINQAFWRKRFKQINAYEKMLMQNGTLVLKFFLNISKEEQARRLVKRIDNPEKHWKFQFSDINERKHWDEYMHSYEQMLKATSTVDAPWYVVPADNKWYTRSVIANIIRKELEKLKLKYPESDAETIKKLADAREGLINEQLKTKKDKTI